MITSTVVLDTRRLKKNSNSYPVKLRVSFNRRSKYYSTGIDMTEESFKKLKNRRVSKEIHSLKEELLEMETRAQAIIRKMPFFSFYNFARKFSQKPSSESAVYTCFQEYITKLYKQERVGSAVCYNDSYKSLKLFKSELRFEEISPEFLENYEKWMYNRGRSRTTVGIYLRCLRTIFNEAIEQGLVARDYYPFGKRRFQIPVGRNIKKALKVAEIGKIYYYKPKFEKEALCRDLWIFSYYANGINLTDLCKLKYKNIQEDYIVFEREKTIRSTRSNPKLISIFVSEDIKRIIEQWGNKERKQDNYIFPFLEPDFTAIQKKKRINLLIHQVNEWMQKIALNLGIQKRITTYTARHSFSTILKHAGASIEFIAESLGHTDVKTTENYLDSFENDTKKQFAEKLSGFKQIKLNENKLAAV